MNSRIVFLEDRKTTSDGSNTFNESSKLFPPQDHRSLKYDEIFDR